MAKNIFNVFMPNVVLDFEVGTIKCNKMLESFTPTNLTHPLSNDKYALTFYVSNIRYYPLMWDDDLQEFYRDCEYENIQGFWFPIPPIQLSEEGIFYNTYIPYPENCYFMDSDLNLNIKSNLKDYILSDITEFIKNNFQYKIEDYKKDNHKIPYNINKDYVWDPNSYPYEYELGVSWGDRDTCSPEELANDPESVSIEINYNTLQSLLDGTSNSSLNKNFFNWKNSIIFMPSYAPIISNGDIVESGHEVVKNLEGQRGSIVIEGKNRNYSTALEEFLNKDNPTYIESNNLLKNTTLLCADPRIANYHSYISENFEDYEDENYGEHFNTSYSPEGEDHGAPEDTTKIYKKARKGYFVVGNTYTKFLIVSPGTLVTFTTMVEEIEVEGNKRESVLLWVITNSSIFEPIDGTVDVYPCIAYAKNFEDFKIGNPSPIRLNSEQVNAEEDDVINEIFVTKEIKEALSKTSRKLSIGIWIGDPNMSGYFNVRDKFGENNEIYEKFFRDSDIYKYYFTYIEY